MAFEEGRIRVVSNTTPISNFIRIARLGLLGQVFGHVVIPTQVAEELERGEHVLGKWRDVPGSEHLAVVAPQDGPFLRQLTLQLDAGEAGAIALAVQHGALLLMDEIPGRKVALHHRLRLSGTLGVIAQAKRVGHLSAVRPLLDSLAEEGYHVSHTLRARVLRDAGESD